MKKITFWIAANILWGMAPCLAQMSVLQTKAMLLKRVIERNHYAPKPVDDLFSEQVYDEIIHTLDDYKLYFTQQDLARLAPFRHQIDDEMAGKSWGFTNLLVKIYGAAKARADTTATALLQKTFSFDTRESFSYSSQQQFPASNAEYQLRWSRYLKWRMLSRLIDNEVSADSIKINKRNILLKEPATRKKILDRKEKLKAKETATPGYSLEDRIGLLYLQTIATTFDPHTEYFPPEEKEDFEEQLSTQTMDFGFTLQPEEDGSLTIGSLVPGGAAWKSGNMHNDDKLIQIKVEDAPAMDVKNASPEEIADLLNNKANKNVEVTVRSADGITKAIALQRQLQRNDDNIVKGFLLNGSKKLGFISLPSFYYQMDNQTGTSCASDVAKEIVKLKKENIEGLILDLRYNGGGSVEEAVEMLGIFIDAGPMLLVRGNDKKTVFIKDPNRGTIYDGPLVVMINGQSASASELVAGTLQDYNRATIIGSNSFGKATMQSLLPMDTTDLSRSNPSPQTKALGYVKTTMGKLFRITGKTAQLTGVQPNVPLPDAFEAAEYTERSLPFALVSDTVMKQVNYVPLLQKPARCRTQQPIEGSKKRLLCPHHYNNWPAKSDGKRSAYPLAMGCVYCAAISG